MGSCACTDVYVNAVEQDVERFLWWVVSRRGSGYVWSNHSPQHQCIST